MTSTGFYTLDDGTSELLRTLYESADTAADGAAAVSASPVYLGDSRRERNDMETRAEPVEHKGIRLHHWVIGCNKTHITPIDTVDECVYSLCVYEFVYTPMAEGVTKLTSVCASLSLSLYVTDSIGQAAKLTPPEMVFGKNQLVLYHELSGVCYSFLAVEALKGAHFPPPVSDQAADIVANKQLKVAIAKHNANKYVELGV